MRRFRTQGKARQLRSRGCEEGRATFMVRGARSRIRHRRGGVRPAASPCSAAVLRTGCGADVAEPRGWGGGVPACPSRSVRSRRARTRSGPGALGPCSPVGEHRLLPLISPPVTPSDFPSYSRANAGTGDAVPGSVSSTPGVLTNKAQSCLSQAGEGRHLSSTPRVPPYRGTSLRNNAHPSRTTRGPYA